MPALTLNPITTASAVTGRQVVATAAGAATNVTVTVAKRTGLHELRSAGGDAGAAAAATGTAVTGTTPAPTGLGFTHDVAVEGWSLTSGSVQPVVRVIGSSTTISGRFYVRMFKRSSAGAYTLIQQWSETAGTAFSVSGGNRTLPAATIPATTFVTGDRIYIDVWADITANTANSNSATVGIQEGGTTAGQQTLFPTAGYTEFLIPIHLKGAANRYHVRQAVKRASHY